MQTTLPPSPFPISPAPASSLIFRQTWPNKLSRKASIYRSDTSPRTDLSKARMLCSTSYRHRSIRTYKIQDAFDLLIPWVRASLIAWCSTL